MTTDKTPFLQEILIPFAELTEKDIEVSLPYWHRRTIAKGGFYNVQNTVCINLGIVVKGMFRVYYADDVSDEEKNLFFFSENQFVVSFRSFLAQYPCAYFIEALEDAEILCVSYSDLHTLYHTSKAWERFGRMLAEHFFNQSQGRSEDLLFFSHEQRYLNLLSQHPGIVERVADFHIASYLGIKKQSLSRIKKRLQEGNNKQAG